MHGHNEKATAGMTRPWPRIRLINARVSGR